MGNPETCGRSLQQAFGSQLRGQKASCQPAPVAAQFRSCHPLLSKRIPPRVEICHEIFNFDDASRLNGFAVNACVRKQYFRGLTGGVLSSNQFKEFMFDRFLAFFVLRIDTLVNYFIFRIWICTDSSALQRSYCFSVKYSKCSPPQF